MLCHLFDFLFLEHPLKVDWDLPGLRRAATAAEAVARAWEAVVSGQ